MNSLIKGTVYTIDAEGLIHVNKTDLGLKFTYNTDVVIDIKIYSDADRDKQYNDIVDCWDKWKTHKEEMSMVSIKL